MLILTAGKLALEVLGGYTAIKYIYTKGKTLLTTAKTDASTIEADVKKVL